VNQWLYNLESRPDRPSGETIMTVQEQLLQELPQLSDDLATEVLDFLLFAKQRRDRQVAQLRPAGLCSGDFTVPDDFDDPLPEEILQSFE
jgi:Protein of unknown function (DUF2281)